jgi:hypothetical protein
MCLNGKTKDNEMVVIVNVGMSLMRSVASSKASSPLSPIVSFLNHSLVFFPSIHPVAI